jgi:hypothetical protein
MSARGGPVGRLRDRRSEPTFHSEPAQVRRLVRECGLGRSLGPREGLLTKEWIRLCNQYLAEINRRREIWEAMVQEVVCPPQ